MDKKFFVYAIAFVGLAALELHLKKKATWTIFETALPVLKENR